MQRPMSIVVVGLPTTSAKIKALIAEGYLRAEVARFLYINYQHVRKVLYDAGIRDGLQNDDDVAARLSPLVTADATTVNFLRCVLNNSSIVACAVLSAAGPARAKGSVRTSKIGGRMRQNVTHRCADFYRTEAPERVSCRRVLRRQRVAARAGRRHGAADVRRA